MQKEFIPGHLDSKLIKIGFNREKRITFIESGKTEDYKLYFKSPYQTEESNSIKWVGGILWQQAFDWFIEEHNLSGEVYCWRTEWHFDIGRTDIDHQVFTNLYEEYKTKMSAQLACLEKLIELVEEKR